MKEHILIRYGQAVRKVRLEQGISQEELADRCGLHRTYISDVELGKRNISLESFNRFLIISLDVLICRYSPLFRAFPALFISEEPHKSFYYPSCFRSQK